jgi:hypothetical protein
LADNFGMELLLVALTPNIAKMLDKSTGIANYFDKSLYRAFFRKSSLQIFNSHKYLLPLQSYA